MMQALKEAQKAYEKLEVPVGAIIVKDGKIIAISEPLLESGAGILIEIEPAGNYEEATALKIIRSIKRM